MKLADRLCLVFLFYFFLLSQYSYNVAMVIEVPPVAVLPNSIVQSRMLRPFRYQTGGTILVSNKPLCVCVRVCVCVCVCVCVYIHVWLCYCFLRLANWPWIEDGLSTLVSSQTNTHTHTHILQNRVYCPHCACSIVLYS